MGLLPNEMFTRMLEHARRRPDDFRGDGRGELFGTMATGGRVGFETVAWFNGGLFDSDAALPLARSEIETTLEAAALDWSEIDPSILGTLFERGLDPAKRAQLGAHYTDREKIMQIVEPVVVRPWLKEWEKTRAEIGLCLERADTAGSRGGQTRWRGRAEEQLRWVFGAVAGVHGAGPGVRVGELPVFGASCVEGRGAQGAAGGGVDGFAAGVSGGRPGEREGDRDQPVCGGVGAGVRCGSGKIQWMRRNGFSGARDPILEPLETIECRDAILAADGGEPAWPEADAVIGNPPFLGGKLLRGVLGGAYVEALQRLYRERIHGEADLVCHWFDKAARLVANGKLGRAGLVATEFYPGRAQPGRAGPDCRTGRDLRCLVG